MKCCIQKEVTLHCGTCNIIFEAERRMIYGCIFCPSLHLEGHINPSSSLISTQVHWWILQGGRGVADNTARDAWCEQLQCYYYY